MTRDVVDFALAASIRPDLRVIETPQAGPDAACVIGNPSRLTALTGWSARRTLVSAVWEVLDIQRAELGRSNGPTIARQRQAKSSHAACNTTGPDIRETRVRFRASCAPLARRAMDH
jgi:hypothetical protein